MAVSFVTPPGPSGMIADRNLYLDKSRDHLALENSVESAFLLNGKGQEIAADEVARLRLVMVDGRVVQASKEPAPVIELEPASDPESHGESEG